MNILKNREPLIFEYEVRLRRASVLNRSLGSFWKILPLQIKLLGSFFDAFLTHYHHMRSSALSAIQYCNQIWRLWNAQPPETSQEALVMMRPLSAQSSVLSAHTRSQDQERESEAGHPVSCTHNNSLISKLSIPCDSTDGTDSIMLIHN